MADSEQNSDTEKRLRKLYQDLDDDPRDFAAKQRLSSFELHFHNIWLEFWSKCTNPQTLNRSMIRSLRVMIADQTARYGQEGAYTTVNPSTTISFDKTIIEASSTNCKYYSNPESIRQARKYDSTVVDVVDGDCLEVAKSALDDGLNPLVLNMCNPNSFGGSWRGGAGAQEENVFRRSLYHLSNSKKDYPIGAADAIYNPDIIVFRSSEANGYELLGQPYVMSFIACPALIRPSCSKKDGELWMVNRAAEKMTAKIRTIYRVGVLENHDCLVLSAFGCGAFKCPPKHVAQLFRDVLEEEEFIGKFRRIVFAIFDDHNARKAHNPEGNVKPFKDVFENFSQ